MWVVFLKETEQQRSFNSRVQAPDVPGYHPKLRHQKDEASTQGKQPSPQGGENRYIVHKHITDQQNSIAFNQANVWGRSIETEQNTLKTYTHTNLNLYKTQTIIPIHPHPNQGNAYSHNHITRNDERHGPVGVVCSGFSSPVAMKGESWVSIMPGLRRMSEKSGFPCMKKKLKKMQGRSNKTQ